MRAEGILYLDLIRHELKFHLEKEQILAEYATHIEELSQEFEQEMNQAESPSFKEWLVERLGTPQEISQIWKDELSVTPRKTQWLFIAVNFSFFICGVGLTLIYKQFDWVWAKSLWGILTSVPALLMGLYMVFWSILGYEIGKAFGHGGRRLLFKTFWIALIPNFILMYLTVFHVIPFNWFEPLLNTAFIMACIASTVCLYPICWMGYRWGKKGSV
jgi:hypothetical protein